MCDFVQPIVRTDLPPLPNGADAPTALEYILSACSVRNLTTPVLAALFKLLRGSTGYSSPQLPHDDAALLQYASRMHALADVNFDGTLNAQEFEILWRNLFEPQNAGPAMLGAEFYSKMVAPAVTFVLGTREVWVNGLPHMLRGKVRRSVEVECTTNDGGK